MSCKCVLADRVCPETNDNRKSAYCPAWVVGVPEVEKDGSGNLIHTLTYTGCVIPKLVLYLIGVTASADHAHAAANEARNSVEKFSLGEKTLRENLLPALLSGGISNPNKLIGE